ncbi:MAG: Crp/Fnr family transcriptional regulator [Chloroflexota bacterium]
MSDRTGRRAMDNELQTRTVPIFRDIPDAALHRLEEESWTRSYPEGQILTSEGDPGDSLLIIESGHVRVSRYSAAGQEIVLAVVEAPDAIGELALIDGAPRSATVIAQSDVTVRIVPRQSFQSLLEENPEVAFAVMRALASMVRETNERLADFLSLDVPGRVAKWLLARAARAGLRQDHGIRVPFVMSQGELAVELGTTRVSINKALKTFESLNAIQLHSDHILISNADLLSEYTY